MKVGWLFSFGVPMSMRSALYVHAKWFAAVAACGAASGQTDSQPARQGGQRVVAADNLCGPNSLLVASHLVGAPASADLIDRELPPDRESHSMLELKRAAMQAGMHCLAVAWDVQDVPDLTLPAIVLLKGATNRPQHYVVLAGRVGDWIQMIDYPQAPRLVHSKYVRQRWSGHALYVARDARGLDMLRAATRDCALRGGVALAALSFGGASLIVLFWLYWRGRTSRPRGITSP